MKKILLAVIYLLMTLGSAFAGPTSPVLCSDLTWTAPMQCSNQTVSVDTSGFLTTSGTYSVTGSWTPGTGGTIEANKYITCPANCTTGTDVASVINACISDMNSAGGGDVILPSGVTCEIGSTIQPMSYVQVYAPDTVIKWTGASGGTMIANDSTAAHITGAGWHGGWLWGYGIGNGTIINLHSSWKGNWGPIRYFGDTPKATFLKVDTTSADTDYHGDSNYNKFGPFLYGEDGKSGGVTTSAITKNGIVLEGNTSPFRSVADNDFYGPTVMFITDGIGLDFVQDCDSNVFTGWHTVTLTTQNSDCTASASPYDCCTGSGAGTCDAAGTVAAFNTSASPSADAGVTAIDIAHLTCETWYYASTNLGKTCVDMNYAGSIKIGTLETDRPFESDSGTTPFWGNGSSYFIVDNYGVSYDIHAMQGTNVNYLKDQLWSINGSTPDDLFPGSAGDLIFSNGTGAPSSSTNLVWNNSTGKLGIGASPSQYVDVQESNNGSVGFSTTNSSTGSAAFAGYSAVSSAADSVLLARGSGSTVTHYGISMAGWNELLSLIGNGLAIGTNTGYPLVFGTNNTEAMRIDSGQNVGIGTTSPAARLDISQSTAGSFTQCMENAGTSSSGTPTHCTLQSSFTTSSTSTATDTNCVTIIAGGSTSVKAYIVGYDTTTGSGSADSEYEMECVASSGYSNVACTSDPGHQIFDISTNVGGLTGSTSGHTICAKVTPSTSNTWHWGIRYSVDTIN